MSTAKANPKAISNPPVDSAAGVRSAQHMTCMEVWGGSQLTTRGIEMGGLDAWVYSKPFGEALRGGDVYYASSCATGRITRLLLADVSGHGISVASSAANLRTLMRRFVNRLDQTEFVRLLNQQFTALSEAGTFATAVVATFFAPTRRMIVCNAGHPRPLLYQAVKKEWILLGEESESGGAINNIPLGILAVTEYDQFDVELEHGDCLLAYTDALIESRDADGEMLGETGLLRIMRHIGDVEPHLLTKTLLTEIVDRHPGNLTEDDVTVLLVRANGHKPRHCFRDILWAQARFAGSLIRAINPWAERPPLPDLNMANIGGAIIPALEQRWRSSAPRHGPPDPTK
ncbi:MAG TPA: PP2C family protein-serine/threonine phosphatase [Candidatus Acidoferrales bacterium]|nr:PP2C family protein-serine/threonine phosphatase [Candidatus Acidoferrales bacterium]